MDFSIIALFSFLFSFIWWYHIYINEQAETVNLALSFLSPTLDIVTGFLLVISAIYLTSSLRSQTGKKQNTCLLTWHIMNLFILVTTCVAQSSLAPRWHSKQSVVQQAKIGYYFVVAGMVSHVFDVYSDLFMLWLLYRFMRPQPTEVDGGSASSSTILFAHDHRIAGDGLFESLMQKYDECKAEKIKRQASAFLAFVIKEWTDEMRTEHSIGLEFMRGGVGMQHSSTAHFEGFGYSPSIRNTSRNESLQSLNYDSMR